ncbi:MAG: hypothetical protein COX31_03510 [Candidatus Moranbacteria bacterium CG23_combo_of_CG06-09_8_20_14_all_40_16]|nr:MAG: hypothetical protein COX31_03510 [Candidatus Moranbacteria bacterium CG23_combo_of_CG06-09_8_20_14_all_40_16]
MPDFLDSLDKLASGQMKVKEIDGCKEEIQEILYRMNIEYNPNKKPEISEKDRAILEPLWKFRKELDEDNWDTFSESRVRDYRKRIFEYLNFTFGIEEDRPDEGQKLSRKGHRTVKVEETSNQFLDNLIKKVIRPGFKINDRLYEYYRNNFLAENKNKREEFKRIKNEIPREEFDKKYDEYLKWEKQHEFTKTIRPADVIIYKSKK